MSDEKLSDIKDLLEDIRAILLLSNNKSIQESKQNLLKEGSEQKRIYDLCDGKTTKEIADEIKKSVEYVDSNISQLKRKGLIKTIERKGNKMHEQRF